MNRQVEQIANKLNIQKLSSVYNISYTEKTSSTNTDALKSAKNGGEHLSCFIAEEQTSGRGRRGNSWQTIPYKSLACSIIVKHGGGDMLPLLSSLIIAKSILKLSLIHI